MGSDPQAGSAVSTKNASNALRTHHLKDGHILDDICEDGPVLSAEMIRPKGVSKATVQRCISKLRPYWSDAQLDQVVELFREYGLF